LQAVKSQVRVLATSRNSFGPSLKPQRTLPASVKMALNQRRSHAGHSHSHHHDNAYLTSTNKKDAGVRITRIGLFVNLGMAIGKGVGGYVFHSQALIADAFHALTDLVSDFMTLASKMNGAG
jgi:Cation efflux family